MSDLRDTSHDSIIRRWGRQEVWASWLTSGCYHWGSICPELFLYSFPLLPGCHDVDSFALTHPPQPDGRSPLRPRAKVNLSCSKLFPQEFGHRHTEVTNMTLCHLSQRVVKLCPSSLYPVFLYFGTCTTQVQCLLVHLRPHSAQTPFPETSAYSPTKRKCMSSFPISSPSPCTSSVSPFSACFSVLFLNHQLSLKFSKHNKQRWSTGRGKRRREKAFFKLGPEPSNMQGTMYFL